MTAGDRQIVIGVMGPGVQATATDRQNAYTLGQLIAQRGWFLLTGGRNVGVMDAASRGAKSAGGFTIGILPGSDRCGVSAAVDLAIVTGMGNARNNINVLSSDIVIACGIGAGTLSEIALALKANRQVLLLTDDARSQSFCHSLSPENVYLTDTAIAAIKAAENILGQRRDLKRE